MQTKGNLGPVYKHDQRKVSAEEIVLKYIHWGDSVAFALRKDMFIVFSEHSRWNVLWFLVANRICSMSQIQKLFNVIKMHCSLISPKNGCNPNIWFGAVKVPVYDGERGFISNVHNWVYQHLLSFFKFSSINKVTKCDEGIWVVLNYMKHFRLEKYKLEASVKTW